MKDKNLAGCLALHLANIAVEEKYLTIMQENQWGVIDLAIFLLNSSEKKIIDKTKEVIERHEEKNIVMISYSNKRYPQMLKQIQKPPFVIFCKGNLTLLEQKCISIVGTRNASAFGLYLCEFLSKQYCKNNFCIVSGMAKGIDTVAHKTALNHNHSTIAVVAHGLDHIYPQSNFILFKEADNINGSLLLLSEYTIFTKPLRHHFPRRNRIISGLSAMTVMVEGGLKSGALITCDYALDQGRDVAAISHDYLLNNAGGNKLLQDGAIDIAALISIEIHDWYHSTLATKSELRGSHQFLGNGIWAKISLNEKEQIA